MPRTIFVDEETVIEPGWANDIDILFVDVFDEAATKANARIALGVVPGTSVGNIVSVVDVGGGTPGLPELSGALLTGLPGGGDMLAATYDPTAVAGDAFAMDNMVEGVATKILTDAERTLIASALQPTDIASGTITARADDIDLSGGTDGDVLAVQADGSLALETPSAGAGDMLAATYDPQTIVGDAFDTDNHTDGITNKVYTATEKTKVAALAAYNAAQTIYVGGNGSDSNDGLSPDLPKLTIGGAITAASALTPASDNIIVICGGDAAEYTEDITVPRYVVIDMPNAHLLGGVTSTSPDAGVRFHRITKTTSGNAVFLDSATSGQFWVNVDRIDIDGTANGLACSQAGALIANVRSIINGGTNHAIVGLATAPGHIHAEVEDIYLTSTGFGVGLAVGGTIHVHTKHILNSGAGAGTAVNGDAGTIHLNANVIDVTSAWDVETGATLYVDCDVITESGASANDGTVVDWKSLVSTALQPAAISDAVYGPAWDGVTDIAPSKNAVYDQMEALSAAGVSDGDKGDVTVSGGGAAWTIDAGVVTLAKQADLAQSTIVGRAAGAGTGVPTALTPTQARTLINVEDGADVTDTANVTAAGALMDSEVTNLADVKAFATTDYATAAQGALADTAVQNTGNESIGGVKTFTSDPIIPDEAYGVGWNGVLEPATKNALYDKISTLGAGGGLTVLDDHDTTGALGLTADSVQAATAVPTSVTLPGSGASAQIRFINRSGSPINVLRGGADTINVEGTPAQTSVAVPDNAQAEFSIYGVESEWQVQVADATGEANVPTVSGAALGVSPWALTPKIGTAFVSRGYAPAPGGSSVVVVHDDVNADVVFSLTNDADAPGNNQVYGTNGSGTKGWKPDPAGGGDVTAAANIADNRVVRGDGGAKGVQESPVAVLDHTQVLTVDVTALTTGRTLTLPDQALNLGAIPEANVSGLTAALAAKAPLVDPEFTGTVTLPTGLTGVLRADSGVVSVDAVAPTVSRTNVPVVDTGTSRTMNIATDLGSAGRQECFIRMSDVGAQYDVVKNIAAVGQRFMVQWTNANPSPAAPFTNNGGGASFVPTTQPTINTQYQTLCLLCVDATTDANVFQILPASL